jgi:hypothetical protein
MLFRNSYGRSALVMLDTHRRNARPKPGRESAVAIDQTRIARLFYCDVLHGRQVWDSERAGCLSFVVEGVRVDVSTSAAGDSEPVVLSVANPGALAERCWDAGYRLRVDHDETGVTLSVFDPFGRRIELAR